MNAIKLLMADHRALKKLMKKVENTTERGIVLRRELFEKIKHEASVHEKAEDKYLYPALLKHKKDRPDALEHLEEVKIMSRLLKELSKTEVSSEEWTAKFTVLKELTDHHIQEEEEEFFPKISKILSDDDLELIGEKIAKYKEQNK